MTIFKYSLLLLCTLILMISCGEKMALPTVHSDPESFGANDTSYIHLHPDWTASSIGYNPVNPMTPVDITIGDDGYLFIADRDNDRILTVTQSGHLITYDNLDNIKPIEQPLAIDIDAKLNLLIVNGSNKVYVWNQYINVFGVSAIATDTTDSGDLDFSTDPSMIDSVFQVHPFYIDPDENASFQGVAFGPSEEHTVYLTDKTNNRIVRLYLGFSAAVRLRNNRLHPLFAGYYYDDVATYGSGAGTVDNPRGITCDDKGNIYFTQLGGNFFVQKLEKDGNGFRSAYTLYKDPIMDLNRFLGPNDIAIGKEDAIFVVDTQDSGRVSKFFNKGVSAGRPVNLGKKGLVDARFNTPYGITISDEEIVYITNTGDHHIERYQYSISDDDIPQEPE